jgi:hypothetical protein
MGRPLFSASYSTPVVRTEPEKAPPIHFEKWTRWNAFDPDSDEFFDSDDAVYEAFLDPADVSAATAEREEREASEPERLAAIIVRELEENRSDSPASSEGTISGRGSPMAVGSEDPAGYRAGDYDRQMETETSIDVRPREEMVMSPLDLLNDRRVMNMPLSPFRRRGFIPRLPPPVTPPHLPDQDDASPSPVPTVTPRLYSWSSRTPLGRGESASPSPVQLQRPRLGPLTNPSARMSFTHLSPAPVRVRMT